MPLLIGAVFNALWPSVGYFRTDLGGVTFGIGLDAGEDSQTEDINLMSAEQYRLRWEQFAGHGDRLDLIDEPAPILAGGAYETEIISGNKLSLH